VGGTGAIRSRSAAPASSVVLTPAVNWTMRETSEPVRFHLFSPLFMHLLSTVWKMLVLPVQGSVIEYSIGFNPQRFGLMALTVGFSADEIVLQSTVQ
jgi:hypothetical protein